jgi:4-carboxymuconolactone decarboxylase
VDSTIRPEKHAVSYRTLLPPICGSREADDNSDFTNPREAARVFTPKLSALVDSPLYSEVWEDADLSKRDCSLITVATLVALGHTDELPAHLNRAIANGVTRTELAAAITTCRQPLTCRGNGYRERSDKGCRWLLLNRPQA